MLYSPTPPNFESQPPAHMVLMVPRRPLRGEGRSQEHRGSYCAYEKASASFPFHRVIAVALGFKREAA